MTESEWLACKNPREMLDDLGDARLCLRRLRLFVCACVRQVWGLLLDEPSRQAVEIGERFADRLADRAELEAASSALWSSGKSTAWAGGWAAAQCVLPFTSRSAARSVAQTASLASEVAAAAGGCGAAAVQADLVRDVFGNPFRPVAFDARFRTPQVLDLAQAAYDERPMEDGLLDPLRLCILADALEEAGYVSRGFCDACDGAGGWASSAGGSGRPGGQAFTACSRCNGSGELPGFAITEHLRSPGPHVRGCWGLDLILGKE